MWFLMKALTSFGSVKIFLLGFFSVSPGSPPAAGGALNLQHHPTNYLMLNHVQLNVTSLNFFELNWLGL